MPTTIDLQQEEPLERRRVAAPRIDATRLCRHPADLALRSSLDVAFDRTGFLYLENAFADSDVSAVLDREMRAFFALADDDPRKRSVCVSDSSVKFGWMPLYGEPAYQPGTLAHVESFDCGRPRRPGDDPLAISRWPDLPDFRDAARAVWSTLSTTGFALLEAIALRLGLEQRYLAERCRQQDRSTMRLLHYPPGTGARSGRDVGIAAHTDFECLTLLYQTAPGLELLDTGGCWRDAAASSNQLVVLFGDMLERYTNGRVRATGHRVRNTRHERYSVVLFFAVNDGVTVEPLPGFAGPGRPPRYAPVTQRDHSAREIARSEANRDQMPRA